MSRPEVFVLAGPNGAGKSTTATVLLPEWLSIDQFVNADLIAAGLSPFAPETTAIQAGRLMIQRIQELLDRRESFAFETTLAGRGHVRLLHEARSRGYLVHLLYIWLGSVEIAISRVESRVRQGGHNVPRDVIERRYWRGLRNLFELYVPLADTWALCDNSSGDFSVVAECRRGEEPSVIHHETYERILEQVKQHGP